jgi:hypothetical protein
MTHVDPSSLAPILIPQPRSILLLGGWLDLRSDPLGLVLHRRDDSISKAGYRLFIGPKESPESIVVVAHDDAGIAHASATIGQLCRQYETRLPRAIIEDWPAIETRGLMLDVSRDRVPTMETLHGYAQLLASLKLNHFQLYTEHAFAYTGHEEVWRDSSPITPAEVRTLDAWCRGAEVSLAANQNCFGHLSKWLAHPRYAPLAETHGDYDFYGLVRKGPHSLCPVDPASLDLVASWLDQLLPCFTSRMVNIGCDETADVGAGRSREAVAARGRFNVYMEFVSAIAQACRSRGSRPMFWADVALRDPERARDIPQDLLCLVWGYEPSSPFDAWCGTLREFGREVWVCPGTSCWRSITGRTREFTGNIESAVSAALKHRATGLLVTAWGDLGHRQQQAITDVRISMAAAKAWNPAALFDPRAASLHVFGDRTLSIASWLGMLGDVDEQIRAIAGRRKEPGTPAPLTNASALFEHLHPCGLPTHLPAEAAPWRVVKERLDQVRAAMPFGVNPRTSREVAHTLDVAEFACLHAIWTREGTRDDGARRDLSDRLEAIIVEHQRLWLLRSRPGGLRESVAWYERLRPALAPGRAST